MRTKNIIAVGAVAVAFYAGMLSTQTDQPKMELQSSTDNTGYKVTRIVRNQDPQYS